MCYADTITNDDGTVTAVCYCGWVQYGHAQESADTAAEAQQNAPDVINADESTPRRRLMFPPPALDRKDLPAMTTPATPTTAPAASGTTTTARAGGRLPSGELRRQVAEVLAARAGTELTPRNIAAALGGKSSGAIGNALAALTAGGYAEQTSTKPIRYRSTPTTADAAVAPIAVPSGTPAHPAPRRPPPRRRPRSPR